MDLTKPIEIAEDIFWIGYVVPNDPFQCHVYLIKNGDESILIDPGSMITFPVVLEKITSLVKLRDIKYIIMHHQDPDIVGCYSTLESIMPNKEKYIVTHWRTSMLLKHYSWKTPFYIVDENGWRLKAGERELEFIFTPYAHFAGAICTFDKKTKTLFSSDIFGAVDDDFKLFADKESIEGIKLFHKHYMPSKQILNYTLKKIEEKKPELIAPQHGSIIKKDIRDYIINNLKNLDCGIYLLDDYVDDIFILSQVEEILKGFFKNMILYTSFEGVLKSLFFNLKAYIPIRKIIITNSNFCYTITENEVLFQDTNKENCSFYEYKFVIRNETIEVKILIFFERKIQQKEKQFLDLLFDKISHYLVISLQKDLYLKALKKKEKELIQKSITDPLTQLYNRGYFEEFLNKKIEEAKRYNFPLSLAIIDIDNFKKINDTYGHTIGDEVLKEIAFILKNRFRGSDLVARYGGEEFVIVMPFTKLNDACKKLNDIREYIAKSKLSSLNLNITVSGGVEEFKNEYSLKEFINKADEKLYIAKKSGKNKIIC